MKTELLIWTLYHVSPISVNKSLADRCLFIKLSVPQRQRGAKNFVEIRVQQKEMTKSSLIGITNVLKAL